MRIVKAIAVTACVIAVCALVVIFIDAVPAPVLIAMSLFYVGLIFKRVYDDLGGDTR